MWRSLRKLVSLLTLQQRWRASWLLVLLLGNALLEMVGVGLVPLYIGILAEPGRLLENERVGEVLAFFGVNSEKLTPSLLLYGGSGLLIGLFTVKLMYVPLLAYLRARYVQGVVQYQASRLFDGYLRAPYEFHLGRNSAELLRNINTECARLGDMLLSPLINFVSQLLITSAIVALLVASVHETALLALLAIAIITIPLVGVLSKRIKRLARRAQEGRKRVLHAVQEGLGGVKELRLLGRESFFIERFRAALRSVLALQRFLQVQNTALPIFMEWIAVAALLLVILVLSISGQSQQSLLPVMALLAVALARLKGSVTHLLQYYAQIRANLISVDVIHRDLSYLSKIQQPISNYGDAGVIKPVATAPGIQLSDVWFRYSGSENYALRGIDLTIRAGEAVGFVGPSGSGKSTLIDVILGILQPERGSVAMSGTDIRQIMTAWQRSVGYVPQAAYLMDGTIRQNIAFGLEEHRIDDYAVRRAVTAADLAEFVDGLPEGAQARIGERGARLSGGQRQRIAIARALYQDPKVLIMDEATSALDNLTEKAVMEAVDSLKGERTILMIAHRLSTVRRCDRIVFLSDGEIAGIGTYDELAESHGEFKRLAQVR